MEKERPSQAILDGDILCYRAAFWADQEGVDSLEERITHDVNAWTPFGVDKAYIALSCSRKDNYRRKFWEPYKAHRDVKRQTPECMDYALELIRSFNILEIPHLEADDIMGMGASSGKSIAVTIDKDLRSVPGWHWNPDKELEPILVSEETADRNFHIQWLTGDTTDNIPGIWKMGPAKATKIIDSVSKDNWTQAVLATYEQSIDRNKEKYTYDYCITMARCVRILRYGETSAKRITTKTIDKEIKLWVPNCWS